MGWSVSLILPLAAMAMGTQPVAPADAGSQRFANVLVTSYVCDMLGFGVNYEGLADWGYAIQAEMVEAGASPEAAMARIRSDVRNARDRFHYIHGYQFMRAVQIDAVSGVVADERLYRFQKSFTDRCRDFTAAPDIGALFTAPERQLSGPDLSRRVTEMYRRLAIVR
jgi:hypothetical protein